MPKFFVYAPDKTDPDTLDKRYEVRSRHFEGINPLIASGVVQVAGMITDPEIPLVDGERKKAIGSALIVQAENIEEVRRLIQNDVYTESGVVRAKVFVTTRADDWQWDQERLVIAPFVPATPFPE